MNDKKNEIREMKSGNQRPDRKSVLGNALSVYTNKNSKDYDPEFDKAVRAKHPSWFVDSVKEKKKHLLEMPKGGARPSVKAVLPHVGKTNSSYDASFDKAIRKKQPQWFSGASGSAGAPVKKTQKSK